MGLVPASIKNKLTYQARPTIPNNKQLTAAEWQQLMSIIDANYLELQALSALVAGLSPLPFIQRDVDFTITEPGVYLFYGGTERTFTIDDDIDGLVEIRTIATANLNLLGTIYSGHLGIIPSGSRATQFRWDSISEQYTY